jgi:hypothetical protein
MPRKNIDHDAVRAALEADGWTITADPLRLSLGTRDMYVDLGADRRTLAAEKDDRRIAVEIQSFLNPSTVRAIQEAVGQYAVYREVMAIKEPDRALYMALSRESYDEAFADQFGQLIRERLRLRLIIYDPDQMRILQWIE